MAGSDSGAKENLTDEALVRLGTAGDQGALRELVRRHQRWIFNIALRMTHDHHDAEDITQEALIRIVSGLSTFRFESTVTTWMYRIAVNEFLHARRFSEEVRLEKMGISATAPERSPSGVPEEELPDRNSVPVELRLLVEEVKIKCLLGMLFCLNRKNRAVFILNAIFGIKSRIVAEIMGMSPLSTRKMVSRSRKRICNFVTNQCGLLNGESPCRCERWVASSLRSGSLDPLHLAFSTPDSRKIRETIYATRDLLGNMSFNRCRELYRDHPLQDSPDFSRRIEQIMQGRDFQAILDVASNK